MKKKEIKIGVIADDFTGASDAASFLEKSGAKTIMFNEVPKIFLEACDAIVVALKTRSVDPEEAIRQTKEAIDFLKNNNVKQIYFKYCSTFDSTPKGNIGVVADFLMEYLDVPYTVLCPSLPINGRIVKDGNLYVNGVKLSESPLKNHPLNPMWDSYIPNLMKDQSKYKCYVMNQEQLQKNFDCQIDELGKLNQHFYLVPDYASDEDGKLIGERFKHLKFLTGGSGLLEFILNRDELKRDIENEQLIKEQRSIILCGSCSLATKKQVHAFKNGGGIVYSVDAFKLIDGSLTVDEIFRFVLNQDATVLIYSDAIDKDVNELKKSELFGLASSCLENLMADLSKLAIQNDFTRIIVGGGETSGAVTKALGFDGFYIGKSIDPGVPELTPLQNTDITLVLKSGNFGSEQFFQKAIGG